MIELVLNERGELGRADGKQMLKSTRQFGMTRVTKEDLPHIEAYKHALTLDYEPPANLAGDGLIYVLYDTNAKAHVGLTIAITVTRKAGWDGIIQVWHCGAHPELQGLNVEFRDLREYQAKYGGNISSWASKGFALSHSGLAKAIVIDWDCYCVTNPQPIFDELAETGMIYWGPNGWREYNIDLFKQFCDCKDVCISIQGGFMAFNCTTYWKPIMLQRHYDDNAGWWWRKTPNGDEGGWRLSLTLLKPNAHQAHIDWVSPVWLNWHNGTPCAVHRCLSKLWPHTQPIWNAELPMEAYVRDLYIEHAGKYHLEPRGCHC